MPKTNSRSIVLECKNVWKIYNEGTPAEVQALRNVNMKVKEGDFIAIQGPSGSGKSTLLHALGCLDVPTRGKVLIGGTDISKMTESERAEVRREKIGFMFQNFNVIPSLTALQNVELPMIFKGMGERERLRKAKEILNLVELGDRISHKPSELSGGQVQRVALARALANEPLIILADEPTGNLDTKSGRGIIELLKNLNEKEGRTILIITHDPVISQAAKKKMYIVDGNICSERTYQKYKKTSI